MKKSNKLFGFCLFVFVLCCAFIVLSNKTYMTNVFSGKSVYLENLNVGDYVEAGALLYADGNHAISNGSSTYHLYHSVYICFSEKDDSECDNTDYVLNLTKDANTIPKYSDIFTTTSNYSGWILKKISQGSSSSGSGKFFVLMVPSNDYSSISKEPSFDNNYTIDGKCSDTSLPAYSWYKNLDFEYEASFPTSSGYKWTSNSWHFLKNDVEFTMTFDANAGDVFSFDFSILYFYNVADSSAYLETKISLNGEQLYYTGYDSLMFKPYDINIKTSGAQQVTLQIYEYKHTDIGGFNLFIDNVRLLSPINSSNTLDTSKISNNDNIYYKAVCGTNVVSDGDLIYLKSDNNSNNNSGNSGNNNGSNGNGNVTDDSNNGNNSGIDNDSSTDDVDKDVPNTGAFLSIGLVAILVFIGITIWNYADRKRKFNRM